MSKNMGACVIEVRLQADTLQVRSELTAWLEAWGVGDYLEASCDTLDQSEEEAQATIAAYEAGLLNLPLVVYSPDQPWIQAFEAALRKHFGESVSCERRVLAAELWQEAWEPNFRFLQTQRFLIGPEDFVGQETDRIIVRLESGSVFGSGQHATTQALVGLLELADEPGQRFLDVGTGTGVLCFVAAHLKYSTICGTDIDADALAVAYRNQMRNGISFSLLEGSIPAASQPWDTIVCNILPPTLTGLIPELCQNLSRQGMLYLAGFNEVNEAEVLAALPETIEARDRKLVRGWVARSFCRRL